MELFKFEAAQGYPEFESKSEEDAFHFGKLNMYGKEWVDLYTGKIEFANCENKLYKLRLQKGARPVIITYSELIRMNVYIEWDYVW